MLTSSLYAQDTKHLRALQWAFALTLTLHCICCQCLMQVPIKHMTDARNAAVHAEIS